MGEIFHNFFYTPIYNLLVIIYNFVPNHDIGISIILLTVVIKVALLPLSKKSIKSQKALQELQPKIDEVKKKHKDNREKQAQELMGVYKDQKVNPLSSCFPMMIQLPFLIAVYRVFIDGFKVESLDNLYSFVFNPGSLDPMFLGSFDLSTPNWIFALAAALSQFWQTKMLMKKKPAIKSGGSKDEGMMSTMNKQMMYFLPGITLIIGLQLPSGLMVYWLTTTLLTVLQQRYYFGKDKDEKPKDDVPKIEKPKDEQQKDEQAKEERPKEEATEPQNTN